MVSICIPTYNNTEYLQRLLDSIIVQTFTNYEVIITDNSENNRIKILVENFNNRKIIYNKNKYGHNAVWNWNRAISMATGTYIKMMFQDDWFTDKDSLACFVEMIEKSKNCDLAFSGTNQVSSNLSYSRYISRKDLRLLKNNSDYLFIANVIGAPSATVFYNKNHYFDENLKWLVDFELYLRILREKNNFEYTTEPLVSIGIHEDQLTNTYEANKELVYKEYKYIYEKNGYKTNKKYKHFMLEQMIKSNQALNEIESLNASYREYYIKKYFFLAKKLLKKSIKHMIGKG